MRRTPGTNNTVPSFIRLNEFVAQSGLSKKQVKTMILRKEIRARKLNPKRNSPWLIPSSELRRLVEEAAA